MQKAYYNMIKGKIEHMMQKLLILINHSITHKLCLLILKGLILQKS